MKQRNIRQKPVCSKPTSRPHQKHTSSRVSARSTPKRHLRTHSQAHISPHFQISGPKTQTSTHLQSNLLNISSRSAWFLPDQSLKSRFKRAIVNVFGLAPPPPSVNVEEFALMSKVFKVVVDVRSAEQRREGKIPRSVHIPLESMTEESRENLIVQFKDLTILCYDQDGSTVDTAATFLRQCGSEAWCLEGGADAFKSFVTKTQTGAYLRTVTLEEARQHIHAQARAGARLPRDYSATAQGQTFSGEAELTHGSESQQASFADDIAEFQTTSSSSQRDAKSQQQNV